MLSIHDGCPGPDQIQLECDDDACGQQSELTIPVYQGQSYLIRIAGKGEAAGPYTLTIDGPDAPGAPSDLNCGVSVEFDAFTTEIYEDGETSPIHSGATTVQFRFNYTDALDFGGLVMNNGAFPEGGPLGPNWGTVPGAGVDDLIGAQALKFHARGEKGGETVTFFVGGVGWDGDIPEEPHPDSTKAIRIEDVELSTDWTEYTINLEGEDLSYVIGGFGWATNATNDPDFNQADSDNTLIFYVDEIYFELDEAAATERLWNSPRFLQSFTTRPLQGVADPVVGDFDHRFRGVAFVYDNALALLAFLTEGTEDGLDRARLIGDAFLYAATHDRSLPDGWLRSAYSAGDLTLPPGWTPNGVEGEVRLAGFYNPQCQQFQQLFADNISTGNTAWAMIALLALHQHSGEPSYLDAARALGEFIQSFRDDTCLDDDGLPIGGFAGGLDDIESPAPEPVTFSSAEHNIDVHAAFTVMHRITGEEEWLDGAEHARRSVWFLWGGDQFECLYAGMDLQDCQVNTAPGQLPLDVQAWAALGIPETCQQFPDLLQCAANHHLTQCHGFQGFDFNDDRDGVWFEGSGHMATAYAFLIDLDQAEAFRAELCRAQAELPEPPLRQELPPPFNNPIGLVAGCHDGISTGFGFQVHKRLHIAATAWHVFAQTGVNPFFLGSSAESVGSR